MVDMVNMACLVIEWVYLIIAIWWLHGSKKKPSAYTYIFFAMAVILFGMVVNNHIPKEYVYVVVFGSALLCIFEFGDKIRDAFLYMIIDYMFLFVLQLLCFAVYMLLGSYEKDNIISDNIILFMHFVILLLVIFLQWKVEIGKYIKAFIRINYVGNILIIIVGIVLIVALAIKKNNGILEERFIASAIICIAIVALFCMKFYGEIKENITYKERLNLQEKYNLVYAELINEIRHRQHDFNNHLQALFSMNMAYNDIDELKKHQADYYKKIHENDSYDLLAKNSSSVLAAFLYLKIQHAKEKQISVDAKIDVKQLENTSSFPDFIELVGNLFDNAFEATMDSDIKEMSFSVIQREQTLDVYSVNPYEWQEGERTDWLIKGGNSSKAAGRGMGVTNIKEIVKKYHGVIEANFDIKDGHKVVIFKITLEIQE